MRISPWESTQACPGQFVFPTLDINEVVVAVKELNINYPPVRKLKSSLSRSWLGFFLWIFFFKRTDLQAARLCPDKCASIYNWSGLKSDVLFITDKSHGKPSHPLAGSFFLTN